MLASTRKSSPEPAQHEPVPKAAGASTSPGGAWSSLALRIDPADSPLEREADATAARVMSGAAASPPSSSSGGELQLKCAECEEEDEYNVRVQRRADAGEAPSFDGSSSDVRDVTSSAGQPLDRASRAFFEPRFGSDFSAVRVHTDASASESARRLHARAYTAGSHIAFRAGEFAPSTARGRMLLAHELTHVVQQAGGVIQRAPEETAPARSTVPGGGATPGAGEGIDVTFLVMTTMSFVPDVKRYVDLNLAHEASYEIASLDDMFQLLEANAASGIRVRRIRIVSHGLATGEVRMENPRNAKKHFVTPKDVAEYAAQPRIRAIVAASLVPGAVVEFWGCSIGRSKEAGEAWATLFGTTFRAQTETFRTGYNRFLRPARRGETGQTDPRKPGRWVVMRHRREIADSDYSVRLAFLRWLLAAYDDLARNGDIDPLPPTGSDEADIAKRLDYMTELFNRNNGDLRNIEITRKGARKYDPIRPGDGAAWQALWQTFTPRAMETITEHPEVAPDVPAVPELPAAIPDIPTDIPVREPSAEQLQDLGLRLSEGEVPARESGAGAPAREPEVDPLINCRVADTSPAGSMFARIPFATDSAVVPAREIDLLRFTTTLGGRLQTTRVRIDGYASTDGSSQYNLGLACRRALNVSGALVSLGVPPGNLTSYAHDETSEFSPGDRAANRIVLLSATPADAALSGATPTTSPAEGSTSRLGPHLIAAGADAARRVANVMPNVSPLVVTTWLGDVRMVPGTIWDGNKMLVWATPMTTYYVIDDRLYEISTGLFLRTFWIDAFSRGVKRAEWLVPLAKIEMAFLTGLLVPWQILLAVTIVDTALTYYAHRDAFNRAFSMAWDTAALLHDIRARYPRYFDHLLGLMVKRLGKEVASDFLRGVSAEDIAFFLGRLLKGIGGLTELTVASLVGVTAQTAALVTITHAPAIAVHGVKATAEAQIAALQAAMLAEGVTMTQEEARVLLRELQAHPDTEQRLLVLQAALSELVPALQGLSKALTKSK